MSNIHTVMSFIRASDCIANGSMAIAVNNLLENPARYIFYIYINYII